MTHIQYVSIISKYYDYDYNMIWQAYLIILLSGKTSALMCILAPMAYGQAWELVQQVFQG